MKSSVTLNSKSNNEKSDDKFISFIYYQKKDSPKYFEIKKRTFFWWLVILPAATLISMTLMTITFIHFSPSHIWQNYLNAKNYNELKLKVKDLENENSLLKEKIQELKTSDDSLAQLPSNTNAPNETAVASNSTNSPINKTEHEKSLSQLPSNTIPQKVEQGLSYLSLFKAVPGQKDLTKPAQLQLSGFATETLRDTIQMRFNITPLIPGEQKVAGHILVIMKGETGLQVYPQMSLNSAESQISYTSGESFATQRFRPVDAGFLKPRKAGQYVFIILIFAKNGDLIHSQSVPLFVKL